MEVKTDVVAAVGLGAEPSLVSRLTHATAVAQRQGLVQDWLILGPLPLKEGQSGSDALDDEQVIGEAKLWPRVKDVARAAGSAELAWEECHLTKDFVIDFNGFFKKQTERGVAYAVCFLVATEERRELKMLVGSNDQAKVYLNSKEIHTNSRARTLIQDDDTIENISMRQGINVLVFKVVNERGDWQGCIRFVERTGLPAKGIRVSLTPEE